MLYKFDMKSYSFNVQSMCNAENKSLVNRNLNPPVVDKERVNKKSIEFNLSDFSAKSYNLF